MDKQQAAAILNGLVKLSGIEVSELSRAAAVARGNLYVFLGQPETTRVGKKSIKRMLGFFNLQEADDGQLTWIPRSVQVWRLKDWSEADRSAIQQCLSLLHDGGLLRGIYNTISDCGAILHFESSPHTQQSHVLTLGESDHIVGLLNDLDRNHDVAREALINIDPEKIRAWGAGLIGVGDFDPPKTLFPTDLRDFDFAGWILLGLELSARGILPNEVRQQISKNEISRT